MLFFWTLVGFIVVFALVVGIKEATDSSKRQTDMAAHFDQVNDFSPTQKIIGTNGMTGLAFDEQQKKICLINNTLKSIGTRVFSYRDLLSSEIFENGVTVSKTLRANQLGSMLIGGLALGGVGAIIGGLSGKTQTSEKVRRVELRLTVNDTNNPHHDILFLHLETEKGSSQYGKATQLARHWHGLIEVLIKRADLEDEAINTNETPQLQSGSVADELTKLAELLDTGVLSIDEFELQKSRLLSA